MYRYAFSNNASSTCSLYLKGDFRRVRFTSRSPAIVARHPSNQTRRTIPPISATTRSTMTGVSAIVPSLYSSVSAALPRSSSSYGGTFRQAFVMGSPLRPARSRFHHQSVSRSGEAVILWMVRSAPLNSSSGSRRRPTKALIVP